MGKNLFETIMGTLVLMLAAGFMSFAYQSSNLKPVEGYPIKAKFDTVAGIGLGSDVRIGGIKIGVVGDMELDPATYKALLTMQVRSGIKIPVDSSAAVVSDGLLGNKYIKIEPGADDKMLAGNETITYTQSAVNLEELIGKMVFSGGGVDKNSAKPSDTKTAPATPPQIPAKP